MSSTFPSYLAPPRSVRLAWPRARGSVPGRCSPQRCPGPRKAYGATADADVYSASAGSLLDALHVHVRASRRPGSRARSATRLGSSVRDVTSTGIGPRWRRIQGVRTREAPSTCSRPPIRGRCFTLPRTAAFGRSPRPRAAQPPCPGADVPASDSDLEPRPTRSCASSTPSARAAGCRRCGAIPTSPRPRAVTRRHGAPRLLRAHQPDGESAQGAHARGRLRPSPATAGERARTSAGAPASARPRARSSTRGSRAPGTAGSCSGRLPRARRRRRGRRAEHGRLAPGRDLHDERGRDRHALACRDDRIRSVRRSLRRHLHGRAAATRPRPPGPRSRATGTERAGGRRTRTRCNASTRPSWNCSTASAPRSRSRTRSTARSTRSTCTTR